MFKSQSTIHKLSKGNTLFRLYSEGPSTDPSPSTGSGTSSSLQSSLHMPSPSNPSSTDAVDSQGSPRGNADNQDFLFKLFTAPDSSLEAASPSSPPASLQASAASSSAAADQPMSAERTSEDQDLGGDMPKTRNDLTAMKDLAELAKNPAAGL